MKWIVRWFVRNTFKAFLERYWLKRSTNVKYDGLVFRVPAGLFHPGLFFSSKFMAGFTKSLDLEGRKVLDLGTGSGIIALVCAQRGAIVTASDISTLAVSTALSNGHQNGISIEVVQSDLFEEIEQIFDFVLINPPYYPKDPKEEWEYAWHCGENHNYFNDLFSTLHLVIHSNSKVFMVLSDGCQIEVIQSLAKSQGYHMDVVATRNFWIEKNYIYNIRQ